MCGIFGYIGKKNNAVNIVLDGLKTLEYRGYDSWGIAFTFIEYKAKKEIKSIKIIKKTGKIGGVVLSEKVRSNFALGHTRWATHGGVTKINAHPHLDCSNKIALIHNGIIENYDEIKNELISNGHNFRSETDTEVAVHLIEENYNKLKKQKIKNKKQKVRLRDDGSTFLEAVRLAFKRFAGLNAIIVMDLDSRSIVAAKNGSPLVLGKGKDENYLASDSHALQRHTRDLYYMEDEEIAIVKRNKIEIYDVKDGNKKNKVNFHRLTCSYKLDGKGSFSHHMLKEIYDQPKIINQIIRNPDKSLQKIVQLIKKSYGTYLVGCGTAAYACLEGTYIFSKIAKRHINYSVGSEFGYLVNYLTNKSLVLALSQSGETIDVIEAIKKAKTKGATIGAMVNVYGSTLCRLSDHQIYLHAGTEQAVVSTKAFTAKLAYLILISFSIIDKKDEGINLLSKSIISVNDILNDEYIRKISKLVKYLNRYNNIYIIGRGLSYPIALESALKIKEASYIHAEGFAAGELKHGVIALIEKGTPCIAFLPNDETYGASLAGAMEMKARGGYIVGISYKPHEVFDCYLPIRDCGIATIIPSAVVGQLLGFLLALERGINPDMPRNLAKSVTVK
ncbi:glutamine--fructose-6-phosphate transaminase (isomerizing) [Candidatus Gottesmanbacteria bacterium CG11_big_fil_rev_8_21_14_0_20_37_11]|uniref:Glutamine--fructose-6-phosphate aminotransferase [isomerizing] n=1 Tax=Candidatus Gottesmanbacteria bacterium CG11_big_fil_rev_8_21_14_0_20_37_11 TaxID=1974575 RepID=A0A2H0NJM7_9BACT|nr:MAG: glutamine--fructose-6-phosphate transaminase (isomerizing) [Candidatus Gottesmanbacteria bacterium CG23_combo_of_CG06-09_8_20_14_all_37_19]PIR08415.1 MAG: glutamine--fructose-6-phosphate transaminase (isomerizing) [Candidatus Gottesmanbacteria bacterium CG11_big_fil_rev_8_21_14_0_20_37_11]